MMGLIICKEHGPDARERGQHAAGAEPKNIEAQVQKGEALTRLIRQLGLPADALGIREAGDQVALTGTVENQAEREKIVLAIGNTEGVGRVDDQPQVARPEPPATLDTVQPRDTRPKIA
jgi:hypothetical protein